MGNTNPMAASSLTRFVLLINSTIATVTTPVTAANIISRGELMELVIKNPTTMPGKIA
jgi:hypothetical protein